MRQPFNRRQSTAFFYALIFGAMASMATWLLSVFAYVGYGCPWFAFLIKDGELEIPYGKEVASERLGLAATGSAYWRDNMARPIEEPGTSVLIDAFPSPADELNPGWVWVWADRKLLGYSTFWQIGRMGFGLPRIAAGSRFDRASNHFVSTYRDGNMRIPLGWPAFLTGVLAIVAFRRQRMRHRPGYCKSCGYDLTGNISGVCPECGRRVHEKSGATVE